MILKAKERYASLLKFFSSHLPAKLIDVEDVNRLHYYKAAGQMEGYISAATGVTLAHAVVHAIIPSRPCGYSRYSM